MEVGKAEETMTSPVPPMTLMGVRVVVGPTVTLLNPVKPLETKDMTGVLEKVQSASLVVVAVQMNRGKTLPHPKQVKAEMVDTSVMSSETMLVKTDTSGVVAVAVPTMEMGPQTMEDSAVAATETIQIQEVLFP